MTGRRRKPNKGSRLSCRTERLMNWEVVMTAAIDRFNVFDPKLLEALQLISDPTQTVCRHIDRGQISGKFDLHNAIFPPTGFHRNDVPMRVRFQMEGYLNHELDLMILMYADTMSGPFSCLGLISHDQHAGMKEVISFPSDYTMQFIGIKYNPNSREGKIFIPKDTYRLLEVKYSEDLYRIRVAALNAIKTVSN
ncbi:MAG: hypothetical protein JWM46_563 [Candidatus Kaiserbacteria bacterium]|nr:hypothetical protein [Candidatus Kaiserbacteria bacterium]